MRLERLELFHVAMPLVRPFRSAVTTLDRIESVVVRMTMDGQQGWSETTPLRAPVYTDEWAGGAFELLRTVIGPLVLGKRFETPEARRAARSRDRRALRDRQRMPPLSDPPRQYQRTSDDALQR